MRIGLTFAVYGMGRYPGLTIRVIVESAPGVVARTGAEIVIRNGTRIR
jgi:hypothetical protein